MNGEDLVSLKGPATVGRTLMIMNTFADKTTRQKKNFAYQYTTLTHSHGKGTVQVVGLVRVNQPQMAIASAPLFS